MTISYITGDATQPIMKPALIMHVCNDVGGWGRGFVLALSKRWKEPERAYRERRAWRLGEVIFARVEGTPGSPDRITVANMVAQHDIKTCAACGHVPIRYDALRYCLETVARTTPDAYTIHAPRFGSGLAGGDWTVAEAMIEKILKDREVYIYDLPP